MKKIEEFNQENGIHIAEILNEEFSHFHVWATQIIVVFKGSEHGEKGLYIYSNGKISFLNGDPAGAGYKDINSLPITDYLRKEGFEFKY